MVRMARLTLVAFLGLSAVLLAEPARVDGKWNAQLQLESITGHPILTFKQDGGAVRNL